MSIFHLFLNRFLANTFSFPGHRAYHRTLFQFTLYYNYIIPLFLNQNFKSGFAFLLLVHHFYAFWRQENLLFQSFYFQIYIH